MKLEALAPYLTPPLLGAAAVGISRFLQALAHKFHQRAVASASKSDDAVTAKWMARADTLAFVTEMFVRWFVPSALAPEPLPRTPAIERVDGGES